MGCSDLRGHTRFVAQILLTHFDTTQMIIQLGIQTYKLTTLSTTISKEIPLETP